MVMSSGTYDQAMELQVEYDTTFPILIDDGTVFSRFDPDGITPKSIWIRPGMQVESTEGIWNTDVIDEFVNGQ
jgi:hypothetical protein